MTTANAPTQPTGPEGLAPVVEDMSINLVPGRTSEPRAAIAQAQDAERLGFRRVWATERYDLKEIGVLLSAVASRTSRLGVGSGVIIPGSRHPLMAAAMGATMTAVHGPRFTMGMGRGDVNLNKGQGIPMVSYEAYIDYVDIIRRLWRGETVNYDGPAGRWEALRMADTPSDPAPEIWSLTLGGPRASRIAARAFDGVIITSYLTPEAAQRAVKAVHEECEKIGRDPKTIRIAMAIITTPDLDDLDTRLIAHCRFVTYLQIPGGGDVYIKWNGWDAKIMEDLRAHPMFTGLKDKPADAMFRREDLLEPAKLIPDSWMRDSCAIGTAKECVRKLEDYRSIGVQEFAVYGSSPAQNAGLIAAWRDRTST